MSDDHLIMSRFENKISKCKSPSDLDKLCRTYLEFRNKYSSEPIVYGTKKFCATLAVDEYEYKNFDTTEYVNFQNNVKLQMAREIISHCVREGFLKFDKEYSVAAMRHYFNAELEVVKPKETR